MTLELAEVDQELLDGGYGPAAQHAMRILIRYGQALGAEEFVSIVSAHIDSCLYHGPSSLDFVARFIELNGRVRVPTTLNVAAVDVGQPNLYEGISSTIDAQRRLTSAYVRLGCQPTLTCAPYQRRVRPRAGEHIAWAESNAIVFANSVLGARTDRYGDFTDLCAALTGRTPSLGFHRDENRRAGLVIEAGPAPDRAQRDLYFASLGYAIGARSGMSVPAIVGLPLDTSEDELKALGSAAASSGAIALFHAVGITPEAPTLDSVCDPNTTPRLRIEARDLHRAQAALCGLAEAEPVGAMCVGTPHFSITEFRRLNDLVASRSAAPSVAVYATTSREIANQVQNSTEFAPLRAFGLKLITDTCAYLTPALRVSPGAIVTNSAKFAHYGPGNLKRRVGLMTLERCVRCAAAGKVTA